MEEIKTDRTPAYCSKWNEGKSP